MKKQQAEKFDSGKVYFLSTGRNYFDKSNNAQGRKKNKQKQ